MRCAPPSTSQQWKNYVKGFKEVRDGIKKNKVHQSFLIINANDPSVSYNSVLREKQIDLYSHGLDECAIDFMFSIATSGSGFIKISFTIITLALFTIFA